MRFWLSLATLVFVLCLPWQSVAGENKRKTEIKFDGDLVEGVNQKPLDSLKQIAEKEKKKNKNHLYQKKRRFDRENKKNLEELKLK